MKYQGIKKIHEGKFITRYDVDYITAEGHAKTYEMISRNKNIETLSDLQNRKADSVVMILTDESGERESWQLKTVWGVGYKFDVHS